MQSRSSLWQSLPTKPGVYIYKDTTGRILYVGKAKSLRVRVRSYFVPVEKLGPKTARLVSEIASIEHIEVMSEIEALLLESKLIKKFKPQFNIALKDGSSPYYIHLTKGTFPKPIINHKPNQALAGPFLNSFLARQILKSFRRIAPFCTAKGNRPCLYSHLGLCNPCPNNPNTTPGEYGKNISRLKKLLRGQFKQVHKNMQKHMQELSNNQQYEEASKVRDQIKNLDYLLSQPIHPEEYLVNPNLTADRRQEALEALRELIKVGPLSRIEMYDIANLSGKDATAAMTVAVDGEVNSANFRHFKIKTKDTPDDVAMMREVLARRLKRDDWGKPDLIVLDGGKSQLSIINWPIPTIGLAKKEEVLTLPTHTGFVEIKLERTNPGLKLLQHLRDEAHRFSRRLHHKLRHKMLR